MRRTAWRYVNRLLRDSMISKTSPTEDVPSMSVMRNIFMHTFGRPQGVLGRLGGIIMARMNADCGAWVGDLLEVGPNDSVFGSGFRTRNGYSAPFEAGGSGACRGRREAFDCHAFEPNPRENCVSITTNATFRQGVEPRNVRLKRGEGSILRKWRSRANSGVQSSLIWGISGKYGCPG